MNWQCKYTTWVSLFHNSFNHFDIVKQLDSQSCQGSQVKGPSIEFKINNSETLVVRRNSLLSISKPISIKTIKGKEGEILEHSIEPIENNEGINTNITKLKEELLSDSSSSNSLGNNHNYFQSYIWKIRFPKDK